MAWLRMKDEFKRQPRCGTVRRPLLSTSCSCVTPWQFGILCILPDSKVIAQGCGYGCQGCGGRQCRRFMCANAVGRGSAVDLAICVRRASFARLVGAVSRTMLREDYLLPDNDAPRGRCPVAVRRQRAAQFREEQGGGTTGEQHSGRFWQARTATFETQSGAIARWHGGLA